MKSQDLFTFKDGILSLFNLPGRLTPSSTLILEEELGKKLFGEKFLAFKYFLGEIQGKMGSNLMYKTYGFKKDIKSIKMSNQHSELIGTGKISLLRLTEKSAIIEIKNNPFSHKYKDLNGLQKESVDYFLSGIMGGAYIVHLDNPHVFCVKEKDVAKGDKKCIFHIKEKSAFPKHSLFFKLVEEIREKYGQSLSVKNYFKFF